MPKKNPKEFKPSVIPYVSPVKSGYGLPVRPGISAAEVAEWDKRVFDLLLTAKEVESRSRLAYVLGENNRLLRASKSATPPAQAVEDAGSGAAIPEKDLPPGPPPEVPPSTWQQAIISVFWNTRWKRILLIIILAFAVLFSVALAVWMAIPDEFRIVILCNILPHYCPKP